MRIDQFVHTLNYGDAISGEAIAISRILREMGFESTIYVVHAHEKVKHLSSHFSGFSEMQSNEKPHAVILHHSIDSPLNRVFMGLSSAVKVMIYHNLTPVKWFLSYNQRVAKDLVKGFEELPALAACADILLADSSYNAKELADVGQPRAKVLPLLLDDKKWAVSANPGIEGILKGHGGKNILHVGRLAPNKKIEDILKAFYFYHHKIEKESRLWLIGSDIDTEIYSFELRRLVSELRLKEAVTFVGSVADSELKSFYQNSDAYICMSEHEGFCVPLVEAMNFGLPVIAFDSSAIRETLGDAGLLIAEKNPSALAELVHIVVTDQALRASLIEKGKERAKAYSEQVFVERLKTLLLEAIEQHIQQRQSSSCFA